MQKRSRSRSRSSLPPGLIYVQDKDLQNFGVFGARHRGTDLISRTPGYFRRPDAFTSEAKKEFLEAFLKYHLMQTSTYKNLRKRLEKRPAPVAMYAPMGKGFVRLLRRMQSSLASDFGDYDDPTLNSILSLADEEKLYLGVEKVKLGNEIY